MRANFIGIGAQKCATSWIYKILSDHPDVLVSRKKELDFFSYWYHHGFDWYERNFPVTGDRKAVGEVSPSYFHDLSAPRRIFEYDREMKLILTLRDPVERAYSQHKHEVRIGTYIGPDFCFEAGLRQNPSYIEQGLYATHLKSWLRYFSIANILVVLFDDVEKSGVDTAKRVYRFLEIDDKHVSSSLMEKTNPSYVVRAPAVDAAKEYSKKVIVGVGMERVWNMLYDSPLRSVYRKMNRIESSAVIPPMLPETAIELRNQFRSELHDLRDLLGIDELAAWV